MWVSGGVRTGPQLTTSAFPTLSVVDEGITWSWTKFDLMPAGCKGVFEFHGAEMACGFAGQANLTTYACAAPQPVRLAAGEHPPLCECQAAGMSRFCRGPRANTSWACQGGDAGNPDGPICCATRDDGHCPDGWSPCAWRPQERIAWLHAPKTGTSFLLMLARLANSSLPPKASVSSKGRFHKLQW